MFCRFLFAATIVFSFGVHAIGQQEPFAVIFNSPFNAEKDVVGELFALQTKEGKLGLSRRWGLLVDRENVSKGLGDKESRFEAIVKKYIDRGFPERVARMEAENEIEFGDSQRPVAVIMSLSLIHI